MAGNGNDSPSGSHLEYRDDLYQEHLFRQYEILVDSSLRVTEWRNAANKYFLAINTFLVSLYGALFVVLGKGVWEFVIAATGITISILWGFLILSYRKLNSAKFLVIHGIERKLPVMIFKNEWDIATRHGAYRIHSRIELYVPVIFGFLYLLTVGLSILF